MQSATERDFNKFYDKATRNIAQLLSNSTQ